jgi:hypothetical protein
VFLLEVGIILGGGRGSCFGVSLDDLLEPRYLIDNQILDGANPLGIHSNVQASQKAAEESCKSSIDNQFLASVQHPI